MSGEEATTSEEEVIVGVTQMEMKTYNLYQLDRLTNPVELLPEVEAHIARIFRQAPKHPERVCNQLMATAGEASALAGWMCWNMHDDGNADRHFDMALNIAKAVGHPALIAGVAGYRSYGLAAKGRHHEALALLLAAQGKIDPKYDPATAAWLYGRSAEEAAALGQRMIVDRSLDDARTALEWIGGMGRNWSDFLSHDRLNSMAIAALGRVQSPGLDFAVNDLMNTLANGDNKTAAIVYADLAVAFGRRREFDRALELASKAADITLRRGGGAVVQSRFRELDELLPDDPSDVVSSLRLLLKDFD